jgi:hypothetical protein
MFFDRLNDDSSPAQKPAPASSDAGHSVTTAPASNAPAGNSPPYKALVNSIITFVTMGVTVMMAACGALVVRRADGVEDTGIVFIGIYMCLFAAILFFYELIQIRPIEKLDGVYKENFGFLYGPNGRGMYMFL